MVPANQAFFTAHFASAASCFFGNFRCSSQRTLNRGPAELYYREIGRGVPVIVLHGGPHFDHRYLLPDMDRLSDSYRLIYYDQRGHGASESRVKPEDVTTRALNRFAKCSTSFSSLERSSIGSARPRADHGQFLPASLKQPRPPAAHGMSARPRTATSRRSALILVETLVGQRRQAQLKMSRYLGTAAVGQGK